MTHDFIDNMALQLTMIVSTVQEKASGNCKEGVAVVAVSHSTSGRASSSIVQRSKDTAGGLSLFDELVHEATVVAPWTSFVK